MIRRAWLSPEPSTAGSDTPPPSRGERAWTALTVPKGAELCCACVASALRVKSLFQYAGAEQGLILAGNFWLLIFPFPFLLFIVHRKCIVHIAHAVQCQKGFDSHEIVSSTRSPRFCRSPGAGLAPGAREAPRPWPQQDAAEARREAAAGPAPPRRPPGPQDPKPAG